MKYVLKISKKSKGCSGCPFFKETRYVYGPDAEMYFCDCPVRPAKTLEVYFHNSVKPADNDCPLEKLQ